MIDRIEEALDSSAAGIAEARAKIAAVRESLAGLDDADIARIAARLETMEADLARMERVGAGQAVAAG